MRYRFVRTPSEEERQELERMTRQAVGRVALRAHMILLSGQGYTVPEIEEIHDTTDETIYKWFDRFDAEGPAGLYDRPRSGRPPKVNDETQEVLEQAVTQSPLELGYNFTHWTVPLLCQHIAETVGQVLCHETVRTALHALGFRWRRPRWAVSRKDPKAAERMAHICEAILTADEDTAILVEDESLFKTLPPLRRMWMRIGQQVRVPTPDQNDDFYLYGALELQTGESVTASFDKAVSDHTLTFLEQVLARYSEREVLLIWDHASYHTSKKVHAWIDEHDRLTVLWLPKYAPEENPMELIWRHLKDRVAANLTRTLEAIEAACQTFFRRHHPVDLLQMAGLPA